MSKIVSHISVLVSMLLVLLSCGEKANPSGTVDSEKELHLLGLLDSLIEQQSEDIPRKKIYIVAHRANTKAGVFNLLPENSISMIEEAIKAGADMVELDVRVTKDGIPVLMHDETIDRTTTGRGKVSDFTCHQLQSFDMKRETAVAVGVKVPTLEDALLACKNRIYVNLDLHSKNVPVQTCVDVIEGTGTENQVMVFVSKEEAGQYQLANIDIAVHPYISSVSQITTNYAQYPGAKLYQYDPLKYMGSDTNFPSEVRKAGYLTYSNFMDYDAQLLIGKTEAIDKFIASETDFIQTDYVEIVDQYLKKKGLR